jgi:NTE family protein
MTTAFVLSGGGSLGAVQVGMLLALADRHIRPDLLVGSSVGALNAAYVAGDPSPTGVARLAEIWSGLSRHDVFPTTLGRAARALGGRTNALADPTPLRHLLTQNLGYQRLEDAPWPLAVVATEVLTGREVVLRAGPAVDAVMASAALPAVFPPVTVEDHLLMDGGVANNTPISVALSLGADRIYVLPTGYACALQEPPRSAIAMALHAVTLTVQRRLIEDTQRLADEVDLRVVPPLCPLTVSPTDFRQSRALIERARASTRSWLDLPTREHPAAHLALHEHQATPMSNQRQEDDARLPA